MLSLRHRLGVRIKEVRKARRMTQERLAEKVGISPRYLSRLETGQQSPSIETLQRLCDHLHTETQELFEFSHQGTVSELRRTLQKLTTELNESQLQSAIKILRALIR